MEETSVDESIPIPKRGTYNLDFLDDNAGINPFESKCKLGASPTGNSGFDENINPFKSKSKLGQSPPQNFDPFKSKSQMRHSPDLFDNKNYEEYNGNQVEDEMDNVSFDQKRYIEDGEFDDGNSDPMFDYGNENAEIIDKNISIATAGKNQFGVALTRAQREQSCDSLEDNVPQDEFTDYDIDASCTRDSLERNLVTYKDDDDHGYDDFEDAESHDENVAGNNALESMLAEADTHGMVQKVKPVALQEHYDDREDLDSLENGEDNQEIAESPVENMDNNLKDLGSNLGETFPYSDITENQTEDSEIPPFGQMSETHPLPDPNLVTEQGKLSASFDDGIPQENLELTEEELFRKECNKYPLLDGLNNEKPKSEPSDDLSSSMVLSSPNFCEDSGLGDSIVTTGSDDLDKVDDMKSEEDMDSLPVSPDQNLTLSQKFDAGFEDDEDVQPDEIMPGMSQAQTSDNGEELFSENESENACTALENRKSNTAYDLDLISGVGDKSECSLVEPGEGEFFDSEQFGEFEGSGEGWDGFFSDEQQREIEKSVANNCQSAFGGNSVSEKGMKEIQAENSFGNILSEEKSVMSPYKPEERVDSLESFMTSPKPEDWADSLDSLMTSPKPEEQVDSLDSLMTSPKPEERVDSLDSLMTSPKPGERVDSLESLTNSCKLEERVDSLESLTTTLKPEERVDSLESLTTSCKPEEQIDSLESLMTSSKPNERLDRLESMSPYKPEELVYNQETIMPSYNSEELLYNQETIMPSYNSEELLYSQESVLSSCKPEQHVDSQDEIGELNPASNVSNDEENDVAKQLAELKAILNSIKSSSDLDEYNLSPEEENLLGQYIDNVPKEPMATVNTMVNDKSVGLSTADSLEDQRLEDSKNMLTAVGCGNEHPHNVSVFSGELNKGHEHLTGLDSEQRPINNIEEFSPKVKETVSENEINTTNYAGGNLGDGFKLGELYTDELLDTVSKQESLSENKQDISKIFNRDTETGDANMATIVSDIAHSIGNKIGFKVSGSSSEDISLNNLSPSKSVESMDKLFAKDGNNIPVSIPSVETSQMSVFGALVCGSQLIASAMVGPSAVCAPALKSPYFNHPLMELGLSDSQQSSPESSPPAIGHVPLSNKQMSVDTERGQQSSPESSPPAIGHVPLSNKQMSVDTERGQNGSILDPMLEQSGSSLSSSGTLDSGPPSKKSSAVENGAASSETADCAAAPPMMRMTSDSAELNMPEDDVSSFTDCFSTPDEVAIARNASDFSTDEKIKMPVPDDRSLSVEADRESSISPIPEDSAVVTKKEPTEEVPTVKKPIKKKLKGKVLKKKSMQPKIPIEAKELEGEDDIKILIAEKKMSSSAEMASNINEDASSSVDIIQVHPNKSPPANAKPSKTKNSKKMISKIAKNSNKEKLPSEQIPVINGHQLVSEHSLDDSLSSSPINCIPRLEKSHSSDSYPEMAPDFGAEDGDAQDMANEGCVPVSDVFNESTAWEMLEKFGEEFKDSDQAPQSVYMKLEPGMSPATPGGGHALRHSNKGNQPITNGERNARAIHEGNEFMQMTSSEPASKTPSSKAHRHPPSARALDGKAGGGSAVMKKREIDNLDNVSVSHKEEKFDKDEKEMDELEYHDAQDYAPAMGDSWVEQVHNFTEIEDSSLGLSQDSLEGLSWSHTDSGLASDSPHPYGCCFDGASLHVVDYDPDSDSGVAVDTSPAHHNSTHAANGTESIVQLVPDPAQQTTGSDPTQVLKYSQSEWNKMKQEQELEFQTRLLQKEKDWSKKLAEKERRITDQEKRIMLLDDQARNLKQSNEDMRLIVAEFEKTIAQLQAEKEKTTSASQESLENLIRERDQAIEDLQSVETAFSDLHRRYEKTKNVVEGFKKNEDILKKCVQDYQLKIKRAEQKLLAIRQQAEEKLEQANTEIDKVRRSTSGEIAKLEAALKKSDIQVQALERTIDQKTIENQELTAICDELINKVGDVS